VSNDFLGVFASSFSSDAVQKGKSLLADRLHTRIISPLINITDSGLLPAGLGSKPLDDEGFPTQATSLVKEGVLRSFLFNAYTANKGKAASTGNAVREVSRHSRRRRYKPLYRAIGRLLLHSPGQAFQHSPNGLYIVDAMGVHTANPISGDFSIGVTGLWIENGEVAFPVKKLSSREICSFLQ